jgi:hypothetical protein
MKIINFLKDQWFFVVFIVVLLMMQCESDKTIKQYEIKLEELDLKIKIYERQDERMRILVDSFSTLDTKVVEKIKTIKEKEYVQIKMVDDMPVSDLQEFFTDRYSESSSSDTE